MKNLYPKGSIIVQKNDTNKYCIINNKDGKYECVIFPIGIIFDFQKKIINFEDVEKVLFIGYFSKEYNKTLINDLKKHNN